MAWRQPEKMEFVDQALSLRLRETVAPELTRLPSAAHFLVWKHLEYPHLKALSCTCRRLRGQLQRMPLSRIGAPMVVSALLTQRTNATPHNDDSVRRFRRLRAGCLSAYLLSVGVGAPLVALSSKVTSTSILAVCVLLLAGAVIAVKTPLEAPSQRRGALAALYLELRAREDVYTASQYRMIRRLWICFSFGVLPSPLLCLPCTPCAVMALLGPVGASVVGVFVVRRELPPGPLRKSLSMQVVWVGTLTFCLLCAGADWRGANTMWTVHLRVLFGFPWSAATIMIAPVLFRQLHTAVLRQSEAELIPHTPRRPGCARAWQEVCCDSATGFCSLCVGIPPAAPAWQRWRLRQVACGLLATRICVIWVLAPLFLEVSLHIAAPRFFLCGPVVLLSLAGLIVLWGDGCRRAVTRGM